jgi:NAD(P)-dependent dehydrogenase (short-subunit alcohol dehydrogenase family)
MSVTLDVTDQRQIEAAVETGDALDVLVNNAGVALYDDLSDRAAARSRRQRLSPSRAPSSMGSRPARRTFSRTDVGVAGR